MTLRSFITKTAVAVTAGGTFLLFGSPAQASSGWDYIGTTDFKYVPDSYIKTSNALSTGGDIEACIVSGSTTRHTYDLWEYDPNNDDEYIGSVSNSGCWIWRNIGKYVDGDNKRAEFYIGTYDVEALWVKWYD